MGVQGELTWTQAAHVLRPSPTSAPLVPGPVLIAGVSPLLQPQGRYGRRGWGTTSPIKALQVPGIQIWMSSHFGERVVCLGDAPGTGFPPQACAGWAQAGWGNIPGKAPPVIGRKSLFWHPGHLISAAAPVLTVSHGHCSLGSWPRTAWQGPGAELSPAYRSLILGGLCFLLSGKHLLPHLKGGGGRGQC